MWLALTAAALAGFAAGGLLRERSARRRISVLQAVVAKQQQGIHRLVRDNALLDQWCIRFRDLYLGAVAQIDPMLAGELRKKWAEVQAPVAVARVLERLRHG